MMLVLLSVVLVSVHAQHQLITTLLEQPYYHQLNQSLANLALLEQDTTPRIVKVHIESPCQQYQANDKCLDQSCAIYELTNKQVKTLGAFLSNGIFSEEGKARTDHSLDDSLDDGYYYDLRASQEGNTNYNGLVVWQYLYSLVDQQPAAYHLLRALHHSINSHIAYRYHADGSASLEQYATRVYKHNRNQFVANLKTMLDAHQVLGLALSQIRNESPLEVHRLSLEVLHHMDLPTNLSQHNLIKVQLINTTMLSELYRLVNCVECLKCKIYGKTQMTGLSSAVLITQDKHQTSLLSRNQVAALIITYLQMGRSLQIFKDVVVPLDGLVQKQRRNQVVIVVVVLLILLALARHQYQRKQQGYQSLPSDSKSL